MSADNDSGYGPGNRSDEFDTTKVRRRIVKYTCHQDEEDEDRYGERKPKTIPNDDDDVEGVQEGSMRWKELSPESSLARRPTHRRSRSSSLSNRSYPMMQKGGRRRSVSRQPKGEISMIEINQRLEKYL